MWQVWEWGSRWARRSNERAVDNARQASTELSRRRVEREDVALYLQQRYGEQPVAARPAVRSRGAGSLA